MLILVPLLVSEATPRRTTHTTTRNLSKLLGLGEKEPVEISFQNIVSFNKETRKIIQLAIPYSISAIISSTSATVCLILVSKHVGTNAVTAYAIVLILMGLTDRMLKSPIYACTSLCARAVGVGNNRLAGQYVQLATIFYMVFNIPVGCIWWKYMYDVVQFLEWGDDATALLSRQFTRVYIWSIILGGISSAVWQLFEIADHTVVGTMTSIAWGIANVIGVSILVTTQQATLPEVGIVFICTAVIFNGLNFILIKRYGWSIPFEGGLFRSVAILEGSTVVRVLRYAVPLSFGVLLGNAQWVVFTRKLGKMRFLQMPIAECLQLLIMSSSYLLLTSVLLKLLRGLF
jgi:Na+-driven multidrug efflux pump